MQQLLTISAHRSSRYQQLQLTFDCAFRVRGDGQRVCGDQYGTPVTSSFGGHRLSRSRLRVGATRDSSRPCATRSRRKSSSRLHQPGERQSRTDPRRSGARPSTCWKIGGQRVRDERLRQTSSRRTFSVELLAADPELGRVFLFFKPSLERLGVHVRMRTSTAQFGVATATNSTLSLSLGQTLTPQRRARLRFAIRQDDHSLDMIGVGVPTMNAMMTDHLRPGPDNLEAPARTRSRSLLWNHCVVPNGPSASASRRSDRFGRPDPNAGVRRASIPDGVVIRCCRKQRDVGQ